MKKTWFLSLVIVILSAPWLFAQEEGFVYKSNEKRDPFWPLVTPNGTITSYEKDLSVYDMDLEGIIVGDDGNNLAIINGIIVQTKDKIGNYVIFEIGQRSVILLKGQEKIELNLKKED